MVTFLDLDLKALWVRWWWRGWLAKKKIRTHHMPWGGQCKSVLVGKRGEGGPKISVRFLRTSWKTPHANINLKFSWKVQGVLKRSTRRNGLSSNNKWAKGNKCSKWHHLKVVFYTHSSVHSTIRYCGKHWCFKLI